jgi:hypothetical protein
MSTPKGPKAIVANKATGITLAERFLLGFLAAIGMAAIMERLAIWLGGWTCGCR